MSQEKLSILLIGWNLTIFVICFLALLEIYKFMHTLINHVLGAIIHVENTLSKMCNLSNEKKKTDIARQATGPLAQIVEIH